MASPSQDDRHTLGHDYDLRPSDTTNNVALQEVRTLTGCFAVTLMPGPYTALLSGTNNGTGVGLVEVYDRPASLPTPTPSPGGGTPTPTPAATPTPTPNTCTENFDGVTAPGAA